MNDSVVGLQVLEMCVVSVAWQIYRLPVPDVPTFGRRQDHMILGHVC